MTPAETLNIQPAICQLILLLLTTEGSCWCYQLLPVICWCFVQVLQRCSCFCVHLVRRGSAAQLETGGQLPKETLTSHQRLPVNAQAAHIATQ
jgi:hypothetical protein